MSRTIRHSTRLKLNIQNLCVYFQILYKDEQLYYPSSITLGRGKVSSWNKRRKRQPTWEAIDEVDELRKAAM